MRCNLLALVVPVLLSASATAQERQLVTFQVVHTPSSTALDVYLLGDLPELGGGDLTRSVKLVSSDRSTWRVTVSLPVNRTYSYQYYDRSRDLPADPTNGIPFGGASADHTDTVALHPSGKIVYAHSSLEAPVLHWRQDEGGFAALPMVDVGPGRAAGERRWEAGPLGEARRPVEFFVTSADGTQRDPADDATYQTPLDALLLQDGELFDYVPAAQVSAPRRDYEVLSTGLSGLSTVSIHSAILGADYDVRVMLPRGYAEHRFRRYPVLYLADGTFVFEDPFYGAPFDADASISTELTRLGAMREVIQVAVDNVGLDLCSWAALRLRDYAPPGDTFRLGTYYAGCTGTVTGEADRFAAFLRDELKPWIDAQYRTLPDREHTAFAGWSAGGTAAFYLGWDFPEVFGRVGAQSLAAGTIGTAFLARVHVEPKRPIRVYLDAGGVGDYLNYLRSLALRDDLLVKTPEPYLLESDLRHFVGALDQGHTAPAAGSRWTEMLPFLFPASEERPACYDGIDNDGDGAVDYDPSGGGDSGCASALDPEVVPEPGQAWLAATGALMLLLASRQRLLRTHNSRRSESDRQTEEMLHEQNRHRPNRRGERPQGCVGEVIRGWLWAGHLLWHGSCCSSERTGRHRSGLERKSTMQSRSSQVRSPSPRDPLPDTGTRQSGRPAPNLEIPVRACVAPGPSLPPGPFRPADESWKRLEPEPGQREPQRSSTERERGLGPAPACRRPGALVVLGVLACLGGAAPARAQAPAVLVKDINEQIEVYGVELLLDERPVDVDGTVFFSGCYNDGTAGCELWKSDGTAAGTVLVKEIRAGSMGSSPSGLTNVDGTLFFTADDGVHGRELWKSDGTEAGTVLVKDVWPGLSGSFIAPQYSLVNANGTLFFSAYDGTHGTELWKSDGTEAGTVLVKDILPGTFDSSLSSLTDVNGTLFFNACSRYDPNEYYSDCELWKSDGTEAGTVLVKDIWPGSYGYESSLPRDLVNANGTLLFTAYDGTYGRELWKSDGTEAGTVLVKDIVPGIDWAANVSSLTTVNGTLFFEVCSPGSYNWDCDLWKSDGTEAGTVLVQVFFPIPGYTDAHPSSLTDVNGTLFFTKCSADDDASPITVCRELWKSDGTGAGTVLVKDIGLTNSDAVGLTNVNGTLFFASMGKLWNSDGTAAGTVVVEQFPLGPSGGGSAPDLLVSSGGTLFFRACSIDRSDCLLWKSDGTEAGTEGVKDGVPGSRGSEPDSLTQVNGTLFFSANDGANGYELWSSDGTEAGTALVRDILPGSGSSAPLDLTRVSGTLFFSARDGSSGREPWKSDGTSAGTVLVKDIWPGSRPDRSYDAIPSHLAEWNGSLFFSAYDGANNWLWKSDGTDGGTVRVKQLRPEQLTEVNGTLFFYSNVGWDRDGYRFGELWKSDGTTEGTALVKAIPPGGPNLEGFLTDVDGTLFFVASDWEHGSSLWKSDGTEAGTVLVKDVFPGTDWDGSFVDSLTQVNGTLFFSASDGSHGAELWMSDGTEAGTVLVKDIWPGEQASAPESLTEVGGSLFFVADDGATGRELWTSDGTEAGTRLVKDIRAGGEGSFPDSLTDLNGTLFLSAYDGTHGFEPWKSDGTEAGTVLAADIFQGSLGSNPTRLTAAGSSLFFSAIGDGIGRELWRVPEPDGVLLGLASVGALALLARRRAAILNA